MIKTAATELQVTSINEKKSSFFKKEISLLRLISPEV
jgi:hypothetical protein